MDQPEHTPSDTFARTRTLSERLKAETNGFAPEGPELAPSPMARTNGTEDPLTARAARDPEAPHDEATPSLMARRFASPNGLAALARQPQYQAHMVREPLAQTPPKRGLGMGALIGVLILVALVPSALLGAMMFGGKIPAPWIAALGGHDGGPTAVEKASVTATLAPATTQEKRAVQVPAVALTAPQRLEGQAGQQIGFAITLDGTDALPPRSIVAVSGLPSGASFSDGRPYGETEWTFRTDEIGDLKLTLPENAAGETKLHVNLVAPDGRLIAGAETALNVAPDPKAALVQRPNEVALVSDLIAHGNKMVSVGYFPGARAYFGRAAEAGSGEAAVLMGETYDPRFIEKMGAHGIKPEPDQAIAWYEKAKALGAADADDKLVGLKVAAKEAGADGDPAPAEAVADQAPASEEPAPAATEAEAAEPPAADSGATEIVEITGMVNVRESPSPTAATLRVIEGGTKVHALQRKLGWVEVMDPNTKETGWVYSRYVTAAAAANAGAPAQ
jgi:hypothetical protein